MKSGESLLLDSHVWLWLVADEARVGTRNAWLVVRSHLAEGRTAISDITFWEIALKSAQGKIDLGPDAEATLKDARKKSRVGVIEVDREILTRSAMMNDAHRDPADRIIMATALKYDLTIATADAPIIEYAKRNRKLKVLDITAGS